MLARFMAGPSDRRGMAEAERLRVVSSKPSLGGALRFPQILAHGDQPRGKATE